MLPQDPVILLSFVNTKLRDCYPSLEELCSAEEATVNCIVRCDRVVIVHGAEKWETLFLFVAVCSFVETFQEFLVDAFVQFVDNGLWFTPAFWSLAPINHPAFW